MKMAVLEKEAFMNLIKAKIGDSTSDEDLKFLEDVTDTYNDLEQKSTNEWEEKYNNLDKEWREKYKARFFQTDNEDENNINNNNEDENKDDVQIEDLFKTE